jgi:hypothetical protein
MKYVNTWEILWFRCGVYEVFAPKGFLRATEVSRQYIGQIFKGKGIQETVPKCL